jgi:arabinan endo-1,5-alpha-L-arabinosidase
MITISTVSACALPIQSSPSRVYTASAESWRDDVVAMVENSNIEIHDPSHFLRDGDYLVIAGSGIFGLGLEYYLIDEDPEGVVLGSRIFSTIKPDWYQEIQVWNDTGEFDAPDMPYPNVIYYTIYDEIHGYVQDATGRAIAIGTPPNRIWIDDGIVIRSAGEKDHPRAMDASVFKDYDGYLWMVFGSHAGGIYIIQLDPETGKLLEHPEDVWVDYKKSQYSERSVHLAIYGGKGEKNAIEAPYIYKNNGYYYLFVNWDGCCAGIASTYNIRLGRSTSPTGPYIDKSDMDMLDGGGSLFLQTENRYIGPGQSGIFNCKGEDGQDLYIFTFHYYDGEDNGKPKLGARYLEWDDDDWPVLVPIRSN